MCRVVPTQGCRPDYDLSIASLEVLPGTDPRSVGNPGRGVLPLYVRDPESDAVVPFNRNIIIPIVRPPRGRWEQERQEEQRKQEELLKKNDSFYENFFLKWSGISQARSLNKMAWDVSSLGKRSLIYLGYLADLITNGNRELLLIALPVVLVIIPWQRIVQVVHASLLIIIDLVKKGGL